MNIIEKKMKEYGHKGVMFQNKVFQALSDKASYAYGHSYEFIYPDLLAKFIDRENINILELGIHKGYSLKMWAEIFPKAHIYGLDYDHSLIDYPYIEFESSITILPQASQDDPSIKHIIPNMDIIIDDASHIPELTMRSWSIYNDKLNPDGIYIIEDVSEGLLSRFSQDFIRLFDMIDLRDKKNRDDDMVLIHIKK